MTLYMLDTNIVSHLVRAHPVVGRHLQRLPIASLCISAITEGELQFGLSKRPNARWLQVVVVEFLKRIKVLPWDGAVARHYGSVRALMESQGKILSPLDLLIATHALNAGAILVTNDKSFGQVPMLQIEDWTR